MPKKRDLTGMRFGRLVVTGEAPPHYTSGGNRKVRWYADCDCGNTNGIYTAGNLLNGYTNSCGCLNKEVISQRMRKQQKRYNKFDITSHDYGIGWTHNTNEEFYFDLEDYDLIKDYCWSKHRQYIEAKIPGTDRRIGLHKLVMNDLDNQYDIDHINTLNHNDNRKCNLRIATRTQNCINKKLQKNNKSGVNGVWWSNYDQRWVASIRINKKQYTYNRRTFEEAVALRKELEEKYYGEDSFDNLQKIAQQYKLKEEETNNG